MQEQGFLDPQDFIMRIGVRPEMHIADFGSGSGDIAIILARLVGEKGSVLALDVMPSAIESIQAKAKSAGLANVSGVRANLETVGGSTLDDHSQDLVFMANILWQSSKKKEILEEAVRILKSNGTLACIEWENAETRLDSARQVGPPASMRIEKKELERLVAMLGFKDITTFPAGAFHYGLTAKKP